MRRIDAAAILEKSSPLFIRAGVRAYSPLSIFGNRLVTDCTAARCHWYF